MCQMFYDMGAVDVGDTLVQDKGKISYISFDLALYTWMRDNIDVDKTLQILPASTEVQLVVSLTLEVQKSLGSFRVVNLPVCRSDKFSDFMFRSQKSNPETN